MGNLWLSRVAIALNTLLLALYGSSLATGLSLLALFVVVVCVGSIIGLSSKTCRRPLMVALVFLNGMLACFGAWSVIASIWAPQALGFDGRSPVALLLSILVLCAPVAATIALIRRWIDQGSDGGSAEDLAQMT